MSVGSVAYYFFNREGVRSAIRLEAGLLRIVRGLVISRGVGAFLFKDGDRFGSLYRRLIAGAGRGCPRVGQICMETRCPFISRGCAGCLLRSCRSACFPRRVMSTNGTSCIRHGQCVVSGDDIYIICCGPSCTPPHHGGSHRSLAARRAGDNAGVTCRCTRGGRGALVGLGWTLFFIFRIHFVKRFLY